MYTWIVSLSDGRRFSLKDLLNDQGENPWDRLIEFINRSKDIDGKPLFITHVEVIVNGRRYNSPSVSKNASFRSSNNLIDKFWIYGQCLADLIGGASQEEYVAYSYRIGEYRHFFWINVQNNYTYAQIMNVINPTTEEEKSYAMNEQVIERIYGSYTCTKT